MQIIPHNDQIRRISSTWVLFNPVILQVGRENVFNTQHNTQHNRF